MKHENLPAKFFAKFNRTKFSPRIFKIVNKGWLRSVTTRKFEKVAKFLNNQKTNIKTVFKILKALHHSPLKTK